MKRNVLVMAQRFISVHVIFETSHSS
jgi:hypothetical protein